jgi:MFS family permease
MSVPGPAPARLTATQWLICIIASIGFAFDIYELLMMPLIARPALAELLKVDPDTASGNAAILRWTGYVMYGSALCGGTFGLLGGYLTDLLGRRRVLVWSILLYAASAAAAGYSTSAEMLLVLRCTTFIGVCVEFVAAVAWLSELFPDAHQRERVLGYTQAFSSIGGLLVTIAYKLSVEHGPHLPDWLAIHGGHAAWRYTLISGLIPAIPLMVIRPFLPESPAWRQKHESGTLKRPSIGELFAPRFRRTTIVTALMFACSYGAAFGAIQLAPQIVPGLVPGLPALAKLRKDLDAAPQGSTQYEAVRSKILPLQNQQKQIVGNVQLYQEMGGLLGRFVLAFLAVRIVGRRKLLRIFQVPGLILVPLVFFVPASGALGPQSLEVMKWGMAIAGFLTVAQFSFWGNYLPRVYPTYLRGTGESFAANVGGRMVGTAANPVATTLATVLLASMPTIPRPAGLAYAAGIVALVVYAIGLIASFWLPEPGPEELAD